MTFKDLVAIILTYTNAIAIILILIIIVAFIYKMIQGILGSDTADNRKKMRDSMIFGLIGIFFAVSFFAIAKFLAAGLGI